ncbi:MAG: hypothetical protein HY763_03965 [Planctomycetes bacterium]|nr:hypothetical protein [Planctomycetota bacterium]
MASDPGGIGNADARLPRPYAHDPEALAATWHRELPPTDLSLWANAGNAATFAPPPLPAKPDGMPDESPSDTDAAARERDRGRRWHLELGLRGGHTKLAETKELLDRRLKLPMKLDFLHVFDEPYTPLDRKSDLGLNTLYLGLGRQESSWWCWTWYVGGGAGTDSDHQQVLNLSLKLDFRYALYYTGAVFEVYPWGTPEYLNNLTWEQRLRASRPYLLTGGEMGYLSARGRGKYAWVPVTVYRDEHTVRDWLFSFLLGVGWGVPLNERWSVNLSLHYSFHFYRPDEYDSWNLVSVLRYRL